MPGYGTEDTLCTRTRQLFVQCLVCIGCQTSIAAGSLTTRAVVYPLPRKLDEFAHAVAQPVGMASPARYIVINQNRI